MTSRLRDWQSRLAALLSERQSMDFEWGRHDCCMFAAACMEAVTGKHPAPELVGTYADEQGAGALLDRLGGVLGIGHRFAGDSISPVQAQVGDIVAVPVGPAEDLALGVCGGDVVHVASVRGTAIVPKARGVSAWRVTKQD